MTKSKKVKTGEQFFRALINSESFNKENRSFDVVIATETPVFRRGWEEDYNEILGCKPDEIRMTRASRGLPVFDLHGFKGMGAQDQLGRCTDIRFEGDKMIGTITLGARADDALISDVENGIVKDISVGYNVYKYMREPTEDGKTPNYRAVDWEPFEVSFAPVQADVNAGIREKNDAVETVIDNYLLKTDKMKIEEIRAKANDEQKARLDAIIQACRAASLSDEKIVDLYESEKTVEQIRSEYRVHAGVDVESIRANATKELKDRMDAILKSTRAAKMEDSKAIEFFNSEKTIEEIRQAVIDTFVSKDPKVTSVAAGEDAIDKKSRAIESAILCRVAPNAFKEEAKVGAEYRGMTLMEMGKELLIESGVNVRGLSKTEIAAKVFQGRRDMATSDFPLLLENVANKALRGEYEFAPEYWNMIARETSVSDFKVKSLYKIGSSNGMKKIKEGDEIKYGSLLESKQTIKVESFAEGLRFTRQAFINDDLSAFSLIPSKFVLDWNTTRGDMVWDMITSNVVMDDGKALFHSGHGNLATTPAVLSDTSLEAALIALKNQTDIDGKRKVRILPKYLIVSANYEITARKLLAIVAPSSTSQVNVFSSLGLTLIVEPRLSGKAWYLSADPAAVEGLYYAYLDGNGGLRSNREDNFNTDSIDLAVRGEFGVAAIDYRGWYKNAGE